MGCLSERVNSVKGTLKHRGAIPGNVLILEHPQEYHRALAAELSCRFGRWSRSLVGKRHIEVRDRPHGHALNPQPNVRGPSRFSVGLPFVQWIPRDAHGRRGGLGTPTVVYRYPRRALVVRAEG